MESATKFVDFFVHDILDYTLLNKEDKNFTKNMTIFNIKHAIKEITECLSDKVRFKDLNVEVKFFGFADGLKNLVKTDMKRMQ